jgi:Fe-S cluster assembly protein SufD
MSTIETVPFIPVQTRRERPTGTHRDDFPVISQRDLQWKLSPAPRISEVVDGILDGSPFGLRVVGASDAHVDVSWVNSSDAHVGRAGQPEDRASGAAWEMARDVCLVVISGEQTDDIELVVDLTSDAETDAARAVHLVVELAPQSKATVVIRYEGHVRVIENHEYVVGAGANLTVNNVYEETPDSIHLGSHFARIGRDATLRHGLVTLSGGIVRVNPSAHLAESGASVTLLGLYTPGDNEHTEHHVYVNHDAPHTTSNVMYKGALRSATSRAVWIGDVLIGQKATGTDSYEQNRNLILHDGARADSIPNLEIETGDIVGAGHASATGRFDEEQLFYLRSRGISESDARMLVVRGFLNEVAQQLGSASISERVESVLDQQFAEGIAS